MVGFHVTVVNKWTYQRTSMDYLPFEVFLIKLYAHKYLEIIT
jgi:hypothetical protein